MAGRRLFILSYAMLFIVTCVPVWWRLTSLPQVALPLTDINNELSKVTTWPITVSIVTADPSLSSALQSRLAPHFALRDDGASGHVAAWRTPVTITASAASLRDLPLHDSRDSIDELLLEHSKREGMSDKPGQYALYVLPPSTPTAAPFFVMGKHRHGWGAGSEDSLFKAMKSVIDTLGQSQSSTREMSVAPSYRLSFSLLNANPSLFHMTWNFRDVQQKLLDSVISRLADFADFEVDSQALHYGELPVDPVKRQTDDGVVYTLSSEDLQFFLQENHWNLNLVSSESSAPTIHFLLYIPNPAFSPLHITAPDGSLLESNAFHVSRWGGVVIFNPSDQKSRSLSVTELQPAVELFVSQLRSLFVVGEAAEGEGSGRRDEVVSAVPSAGGVADWEVDTLVQRRTRQNLDVALNSLRALPVLIQENAQTMAVTESIKNAVTASLLSIDQTRAASLHSDQGGAVRASRQAWHSSEQAFFDPAIYHVEDVPEDNKYAMYVPLILPTVIPVCSKFVAEVKRRLAKRRGAV